MTTTEIQEHAAKLSAETNLFNARVRELGLRDIADFYWYHCVDLPHGLTTPGVYDFRQTIREFPFPADMRGMSVLDVGSATGFFAFEFEKRGADVTSVELDSLESLDRFPGQPIEPVLAQIERMMISESAAPRNFTAGELYFNLLEGPFRFCHELRRSAVRRCYSSVYGLTAEKLGRKGFDLVFMGDILLHTVNPLQALAAVTPLCAGSLVLSQVIPDNAEDRPAMLYVGGDNPTRDEVSWWWPNKPCLIQLLKKLGFRSVEQTGSHIATMRTSGYQNERAIFQATR